jgi:hypothetical protein
VCQAVSVNACPGECGPRARRPLGRERSARARRPDQAIGGASPAIFARASTKPSTICGTTEPAGSGSASVIFYTSLAVRRIPPRSCERCRRIVPSYFGEPIGLSREQFRSVVRHRGSARDKRPRPPEGAHRRVRDVRALARDTRRDGGSIERRRDDPYDVGGHAAVVSIAVRDRALEAEAVAGIEQEMTISDPEIE